MEEYNIIESLVAESNIYLQLSEFESLDFDTKNDLEFINDCIVNCFDESFLKIDSIELSENSLLLNMKFVDLIKYCQQKKYKNYGYIFIGFCDWFNVDSCKVYQQLHEKLQNIIKKSTIELCGKSVCMKKYKEIQRKKLEENKNNTETIKVRTLFDISKK